VVVVWSCLEFFLVEAKLRLCFLVIIYDACIMKRRKKCSVEIFG